MKRKKITWNLLALLVYLVFFACIAPGPAGADDAHTSEPWADDDLFAENHQPLADPLEPLNRVFFTFNDKLYFWVLKPVATGYSRVVSEDIRICVRDFFHNLTAPIRIVNNLLQGKVKNSGIEVARFVINTTAGVGGLGDPARTDFDLYPKDEDLGQTLGVYGAGEGFYICWPILGPSTLRDSIGLAGDTFLNPLYYLGAADTAAGIGAYAGRDVNNTSLVLGDYEQFVESAFDPYLAVRDAYRQYRRNKIKDEDGMRGTPFSMRRREKGPGVVAAHAAALGPDDAFFVQVGAYVDPARVVAARQRLRDLAQEAVVKVYDRGAYRFYGVQVPAGSSFTKAKRMEQRLYAAGFLETLVVAR